MLLNEQAVIAQTVLLEAEGESFEGKVAVAQVIVNRMRLHHLTAYEVCWAPWQFSCWQANLDQISKRFKNAQSDIVGQCWQAASMAGDPNSVRHDPTDGATHYLNLELTKQQRGDGSLPGWVEKLEHTVKIGQHDFYKEKQ